ncbi:metallopeptidase family protein [bacterium]|nr:metallopeptidase family protein [bacterium]
MTFETFEQAVDEAVEQIPEKFKQILETEGLEIIPRDIVPERVHELFPDRIVFGIFAGISRKHRNVFNIQLEPTRIEIYQESIEQVFGPLPTPQVKDQIVKTVIHEIAHYFGFNEKEVRERGY